MRSLIAEQQNRATVRWWDLEFAPLLVSLGFKARTCETILKLTDPEVARYEPHHGGEIHAKTSYGEYIFNA